jgi:DNA replication protein DnaC
LSDCSYIGRNENLIITGCTETGKSLLPTALGHQSCTKEYRVLYYNFNKLFQKLMLAKADGSYIRELSKIENHDLLITDDSGLQAINNEKQMIIIDLIVKYRCRCSTYFNLFPIYFSDQLLVVEILIKILNVFFNRI